MTTRLVEPWAARVDGKDAGSQPRLLSQARNRPRVDGVRVSEFFVCVRRP